MNISTDTPKIKSLFEPILLLVLVAISIVSTYFIYKNGTILAYGDAAAHMNIAKRSVDGLTPGLGQLGAVWLPLQHIMIMPFLWNDFMWRSGLAGSLVSMLAYIFSSIFIYRSLRLLHFSILFAAMSTLVYSLNPNILYMQSTAMGELPLLLMYTGSIYYFIKWMSGREKIELLVISAFFGFLGTLIRYDAWFLVGIETLLICITSIFKNGSFRDAEGKSIIHGFLAYLGIVFWLLWNYFIFGNPFNFFSGQYTAREQQMGWLREGKLITYMNPIESVIHYGMATMLNSTQLVSALAGIGLVVMLFNAVMKKQYRNLLTLIFATPFIFYVFTLIIGNSILFIPGLSPESVGRSIFNIRYGLMMMPFMAVMIGFLIRANKYLSILTIGLVIGSYVYIYMNSEVITYVEGTTGISSRYVAGINPTEKWFNENYKDGYVLLNTYYGAVDIANLVIPMNRIIYEGSYKYWQESLVQPDKYAKWIILKESDKDPIWHQSKSHQNYFNNFQVIFEDAETKVYIRK